MAISDREGFLAALFDFSFRRLVTPHVARWAYSLGVALAGLLATVFLLASLVQGGAAALFGVVAAPVGFLLACASLRLALEALVVLFHIHEALSELVRQKGPPTR
jgi:hypothetical protein